jgi:alanyl-tRNA synthetase
VQEQESLLWKVSEVLTAPVDKLDKTAEKTVKELKEANVEKRRLVKELAEKEGAATQTKVTNGSVEINGVALFKRDFGDIIDVNRMVQTASEMIKRSEETVTLFYGSDGKTCRLMIMAGEAAVKKGVNAGHIVKEVSPIFGGGGGGRANFAQGGGTKVDRLLDAVRSAEDLVKKQVES